MIVQVTIAQTTIVQAMILQATIAQTTIVQAMIKDDTIEEKKSNVEFRTHEAR
jgi:hypothetical protein